ncbi:MAG: membrane protein insertase YidC [Bacillaceae bacterium]|nr:membrane protein insertase YidC [Bacillaceae bacterium]
MILATGCSPDFTQFKPIDPVNGGIWDRYFVFPLSWLLDQSAAFMFGNYGLAILIVTIIIRLLTLPLMLKQIKSSKQMQLIQPEMQKIREKFKDNQQKLQEETMKLFQKHNINPLAGCLPLLVQMPILIAFYHAIMRNSEVREHTFLWMDLGEKDPFYIIPLLAALTTYLQQKFMGVNQDNPQMKMMLVMMPILIFVFAIQFPSALSLYWVFGNIFTIVQTYFVKGHELKDQKEAAK